MTEYLREVPTILAQGALFLPLKDAKLVPVDVADIAKAAYLLLTTPGHEGKIYAMSGPEALNMEEIAEQISLTVSKTVRYVGISREERRRALLAAGVPSFFVDALDVQAGERLNGTEATVHSETHTTFGIPQPHSPTLRVAMPVPFSGNRATLDSSKGRLKEWVLEIGRCDERRQEYNEPQERGQYE